MSETQTTEIDHCFYVLIECPACDKEFHYGLIMSLHEHRGRLAIPVDIMEQQRVDCPHCDAEIWYGELDYEVEGGGEQDGEDEEEAS